MNWLLLLHNLLQYMWHSHTVQRASHLIQLDLKSQMFRTLSLIWTDVNCCFCFFLPKLFHSLNINVVVDIVPVVVVVVGTNSVLCCFHSSHHWFCQHHPLIVIRNPSPFWTCTCVAPLCAQTTFSPQTQWIRMMLVSPGIADHRRSMLRFGTPLEGVESRLPVVDRWAKKRQQTETFYWWTNRF